jgi:5-(carboxyamino)imidazole ribonucleotide synthase
MFAVAARRLGYGVAVWDPDADAPAHRFADLSFTQAFMDEATRTRFARSVKAVTLEWENIPSELCARLEEDLPVRPSSAVLRIIQDRIEQKSFLQALGLAVPRFRILTRPDELRHTVQPGVPFVCKTARAGYDGKGQWTIHHSDDMAAVQGALAQNARPGMRWIVEELLRFEQEISVLVCRTIKGAMCTYPPVVNIHEGGILRQTTAPAELPPAIPEQAAGLACRAVEGLNGVGVFCVEIFVMGDGRLLINEVAPRPHNSGHFTLDACSVSQFEQQVRILCGLPLGEVRLLSPAVMVNLIGPEVYSLMDQEKASSSVWQVPGAAVHLYGKREVRPRRKMGHVTFLAPTVREALVRAEAFRAVLHP